MTPPIGSSSVATRAQGGDEVLTFQTAGDWDAAVSESGVVHESTANTDHNDGALAKMGFSPSSPTPSSPIRYYPMHEDSGTTAYDFSANSDNATINGATVNQTALLGTTGYSFDGTNSVQTNYFYSDPTQAICGSAWVKTSDSSGVRLGIMGARGTDSGDSAASNIWFAMENNVLRFSIDDPGGGNAETITGGTSINDGNWHHVAFVFDNPNNSAEIFLDGSSEVSSASVGNEGNQDAQALGIGDVPGAGGVDPWIGDLTETRIYDGVALSSTQIQNIYDVVNAESSLTTATKSFSSPTKPGLQNLSYSQNSQSISLDIIGSPAGTSETKTQNLFGQTSQDLTWTNSHTNFRIKPKLSTTDRTTTPTVDRIELVSP